MTWLFPHQAGLCQKELSFILPLFISATFIPPQGIYTGTKQRVTGKNTGLSDCMVQLSTIGYGYTTSNRLKPCIISLQIQKKQNEELQNFTGEIQSSCIHR